MLYLLYFYVHLKHMRETLHTNSLMLLPPEVLSSSLDCMCIPPLFYLHSKIRLMHSGVFASPVIRQAGAN